MLLEPMFEHVCPLTSFARQRLLAMRTAKDSLGGLDGDGGTQNIFR